MMPILGFLEVLSYPAGARAAVWTAHVYPWWGHMALPCKHLSAAVGSRFAFLGWYSFVAMVSAHAKLLRSVSGLAGVSDRTLSSILTWVSKNPAVLDGNTSHGAVRGGTRVQYARACD